MSPFRAAPRRLLVVALIVLGCGQSAVSSGPPGSSPRSDSPLPAASAHASVAPPPATGVASPSGWIVFSRYDTALGDEGPFLGATIMHPDGTDERDVKVPLQVGDLGAVWSRDGSRLLVNTFTPPGPGRVAVMNSDGSAFTPVAPAQRGLDANCSDWSPDAKDLICQGGGSNPADDGIYLVRISDGTVRRLTTSPFHFVEGTAGSCGGGENRARYSPDGSQVAFIRQRCGTGPNPSADESAAIEVMAPDGSDLRELVPQGRVRSHAGSQLSWSPDGTSIAFGSQEGGLYQVDVATGDVTPIQLPASVGSHFALGPEWSPDGARVMFSMFLDSKGSTDLYMVKPDGTDLVQVTDVPGCELWTRWAPARSP